MNTISFFAAGLPKAQPRPRAFAMGGKARVYNPATAEGWKSAIAVAAQDHIPPVPLECPVVVSEIFLMPRPKRLMRKKDPDLRIPHTAKPDRDNLDKAVLDALTTLGFWRDDSQVWSGTVSKMYHAKSEVPGAHIVIEWEL